MLTQEEKNVLWEELRTLAREAVKEIDNTVFEGVVPRVDEDGFIIEVTLCERIIPWRHPALGRANVIYAGDIKGKWSEIPEGGLQEFLRKEMLKLRDELKQSALEWAKAG